MIDKSVLRRLIIDQVKKEMAKKNLEKVFDKVLIDEATYQIYLLEKTFKKDLTEKEVEEILDGGILNIASFFNQKTVQENRIIHPFRYEDIQRPKATRDSDGNIVWQEITQEVKLKKNFSAKDILNYAQSRIPTMERDESNVKKVEWLLSRAAAFISEQKIKDNEFISKNDLILFSIDAASEASVRDNQMIRDMFSIKNFFREGLSIYFDKLNALNQFG